MDNREQDDRPRRKSREPELWQCCVDVWEWEFEGCGVGALLNLPRESLQLSVLLFFF